VTKSFWRIAAGVLILGLGAVAALQQRTIADLRAQQASLQDNMKNLERARAAAKPSTDSPSDDDQRAQDSREILRLRSEMTRLREQAKQAEALEAANAKLLQALQENGSPLTNQSTAVTAVRKRGAVLGVGFVPPESAPPNQRYQGVLVSSILPDAPAAHSGLRPGDIIYRVDGRSVLTPAQLESTMLATRPGDTVVVNVMRGDQALEMSVQTRGWPGQ